MRLFLFARLALLCVLLACSRGEAETVEQVINPKRASNSWVSDMARVLDADTRRKLNGLANGLERRTGTEMAIVTIESADGLEPKPFATALFNRWGIGKRGSDNGVLLLLVMEARRVEVETGSGVGQILPDARVQSILNERAVPRFREGDYSGGVLASAREMIRAIERAQGARLAAPTARQKPTAKSSGKVRVLPKRTHVAPKRTQVPQLPARSESSRNDVPSTPGYAESSPEAGSGSGRSSGGAGWLPLVGGALLLPLGGWIALRSRERHCPRCKQKMKRLSEAEDDAHLLFDQKFEEDLGSVDYRAWKCEACGAITLERAVKWFSGYGDCPRCAHRTVSSQTTILRHPSYTHTGESLTVRLCRFPRCGFRDQQRRTLPRKQRTTSHGSSGFRSGSSGSSRSSSSGSFGGGSSSGGGAGASW